MSEGSILIWTNKWRFHPYIDQWMKILSSPGATLLRLTHGWSFHPYLDQWVKVPSLSGETHTRLTNVWRFHRYLDQWVKIPSLSRPMSEGSILICTNEWRFYSCLMKFFWDWSMGKGSTLIWTNEGRFHPHLLQLFWDWPMGEVSSLIWWLLLDYWTMGENSILTRVLAQIGQWVKFLSSMLRLLRDITNMLTFDFYLVRLLWDWPMGECFIYTWWGFSDIDQWVNVSFLFGEASLVLTNHQWVNVSFLLGEASLGLTNHQWVNISFLLGEASLVLTNGWTFHFYLVRLIIHQWEKAFNAENQKANLHYKVLLITFHIQLLAYRISCVYNMYNS